MIFPSRDIPKLAVAAAVAAAAGLYIGHLKDKLTKANERLDVVERAEEAQGKINEASAKALDTVVYRQVNAERKVAYVERAIYNAEGAQQLVPRDVATAWAAGIASLRYDTGTDVHKSAGSGDAEGTVQKTPGTKP